MTSGPKAKAPFFLRDILAGSFVADIAEKDLKQRIMEKSCTDIANLLNSRGYELIDFRQINTQDQDEIQKFCRMSEKIIDQHISYLSHTKITTEAADSRLDFTLKLHIQTTLRYMNSDEDMLLKARLNIQTALLNIDKEVP